MSNNLNWSEGVGDLGLSTEDKKMDIFFQPALTWSVGEAKGIGLFFLENDPAKATGGDDFKRLAKGFISWIWEAAGKGKTEEIDSIEGLSLFQNIYKQFIKQPFTLEELMVFLKKNYTFQIQECTSAIKGVIFPMFPQLDFEIGANTIIESDTRERREATTNIGFFSGQILSTESNANNTTLEVSTMARQFIFKDYGRLLMRGALQMFIDYLEQHPGTEGEKLTISSLLDKFNEQDRQTDINKLAGMVSRFMLHGVRLDHDDQGEKPLYEATGQQFLLSNALVDTSGYQFKIEADAIENFLKFPSLDEETSDEDTSDKEPNRSFTYDIPLNGAGHKAPLLALANAYNSLDNKANPIALTEGAIKTVPFYREEPRLFALRKWVKWGNQSKVLFQVPQSLDSFLRKRDPNPTISLFKVDPAQRPENLTAANFSIKNEAYNWSTRINISVNKVTKSVDGGDLPNTYKLSGISEAEINLLESLLNQPTLLTGATLHLLYASDGGTTAPTLKLFPGTKDKFTLIRNNFSTNNLSSTTSTPAIEAKMSDAEMSDFLQLLWEGATIGNGGYFLHLPSVDQEVDGLFKSGDTAQLVLIVEFESQAEDEIFDFHNNLILNIANDAAIKALETELLIAKIEDGEDENGEEINEKIPLLNVPPGFFGFKLEREKLTKDKALGEILELRILAATKLKNEPTTASGGVDVNKDATLKAFYPDKNGNWVFGEVNGKQGWIPKTQTIKIPPAKEGEEETEAEQTVLDLPATKVAELNRKYAERELPRLYQLLGFKVNEDNNPDKLPIGPTVDKKKPKAEQMWQYERLVPAFSILPPNNPANDSLEVVPDPARNPYNGIKGDLDTELNLEFWWQDIYGNKLTDQVIPKPLRVKYTDPLIGINQWPSVTEAYQFSGDGNLEIGFSFSTAGYENLIPGNATARRLKADLERYTLLYYQMSQDDIKLLVHTSLDADWETTFTFGSASNQESLLAFLLKIYQYLLKLHEFLVTLEQFEKDHGEKISQDVQAKIDEPGLRTDIEAEMRVKIQALLEAEIIPQINEALKDPANANLDFNTRLEERLAAELPARLTAELSKRTDNELNNRITKLKKDKFEEKLITRFTSANSGLSQATIAGLVIPPPFAKSIDISSGNSTAITPENKFIQGVDVSITITRAEQNIHPAILRNTDSNSTAFLDSKYQEVHKSLAILSPKHTSSSYSIPETSMTLEGIIAEEIERNPQSSLTIENLINWNRDTAGIIQENESYPLKDLIDLEENQKTEQLETTLVISETSDTLNSLVGRIKAAIEDALLPEEGNSVETRPTVNFSLLDFIEKFKGNAEVTIFKPGVELIMEAPNLRQFAENFSETFSGYQLAVSEERNSNTTASTNGSRPESGPRTFLFAVNLGANGISYDIQEQDPNIYAIPPLSTTLFTGKVAIQNYPIVDNAAMVEKEVNAADMNVLARNFLVAIEDFLKPETLIPAYALNETAVNTILHNKYQLAEQLSKTVMPVLQEDNNATKTRIEEAQRAIRHKLRLNLVEGYDIESIVQFSATVVDKSGQTNSELAPRLAGRAKVIGISLGEDLEDSEVVDPKNIDYLITPGYFELSGDTAGKAASFTYLFDTKTPEKFGNINLELEFEPLEIEYNLQSIHSGFLASDKLRFIQPEKLNTYRVTDKMIEALTESSPLRATLEAIKDKSFFSLTAFETAIIGEDGSNKPSDYDEFRGKILMHANRNYMGKSAVPIPLRYYPQPPSLIFQRAESDESSLENINDLREWEYKIVYEHQDIAQDSIDCIVRLNIIENEFGKGAIPVFTNLEAAIVAVNAAKTAAKNQETLTENAKAALDIATERSEKNAEALKARIAATAAVTAAMKAVAAAKFVEAKGEVDSDEVLVATTAAEEAKTAAKNAKILATQAAETVDNLFDALVNFAEISTQISTDLEPLQEKILTTSQKTQVNNALKALEQLSNKVVANWGSVTIYNNSTYYRPETGDLHFEISEEPLTSEDTTIEKREATVKLLNPDDTSNRAGIKPLLPLLDLPGFSRELTSEDTPPHEAIPEIRKFIFHEGNLTNEEEGQPVFAFDPHDYGDSSIPDRVFRIENLDVLQYQNAAASIWLSRNKVLVANKPTNDAFVFQTPAVSFANPVVPFITNDEPFDIALLGSTHRTPVKRTLQEHMVKLLDLLEPKATTLLPEDYRYEVRLSCRFAFSLASAKGLNDDLVSTLPLLIGLRLAPLDSLNDKNQSKTLLTYPEKLRKEISTWFQKNRPVEESAYLLFTMDIFSKLDPNENSSLPMLRVRRMELKLKDISDMATVRVAQLQG